MIPEPRPSAPPLPRGALSERIPGQSVIQELLIAHQHDTKRTLLGRVFGAHLLGAESAPWYRGALGELATARVLSALGPDWTILHAIPVGSGTSDIDHVVIGPGGVFTLNTKHHAGQPVWAAKSTLMVAGKRQRHIHNAVFEAERAGKLLSAALGRPISVRGTVVIVDAKSVNIKEKHPAIAVLTPHQLLKWLRRRPPVLTAAQVAAVTVAAVQPNTWHRNPQNLVAPSTIAAEFARLRAQIDQARRRRRGWALVAIAALLGLVSGVLPALVAEVLSTIAS